MTEDSDDVLAGVGPCGAPPASLGLAIVEADVRRRPLRVLRSWQPQVALAAYPGAMSPGLVAPTTAELERQSAEALLQEALQHVGATGPVASVEATTMVLEGQAGATLSTVSGKGSVLVVGGNRRRRWQNALWGSTMGQLLRDCRTAVMVVPEGVAARPFRRVVVWIDPACDGSAALRWAQEEAVRHGCPLEAVTVLSDADQRDGDMPVARAWRRLDTFVRAHVVLRGRYPVTTRVLLGHPSEALAAEASAEDLLVVQRTSTSGPWAWLRATPAEECVRSARGVVVVLPPPV